MPLIRPLALPIEHGGWALLLEPIVLGLIVAPSIPGSLIGCGAVAIFLLRQPLRLAAYDWTRRRYPRTAVCEALAATFAAAAVIAFGAAFGPALLPLIAAMPFVAVQFVYDYRKQNRSLIAELCGAIAPAAVIASIVLAAGKPWSMAIAFSALVLARSIPTVLYVRSVLRGESRRVMLAAHAIAIVVARFISWTSMIAMALLLARAIPAAKRIRAKTIGMREIGWGLSFVILSAV